MNGAHCCDRIVVAQLGAREHYSVARMCHAAGCLARMHTDFWCPMPRSIRGLLHHAAGNSGRRILGRHHDDIPSGRVVHHSLPAAYWQLRLWAASNRAEAYDIHRRWGTHFARRVASALIRDEPSTYFGFASASYEALRAAKALGALAVLDEVAPTHLEDEIAQGEQQRFAGWEPTERPTPRSFLDRIEREWEVADRIIVNSHWTRKALVRQGVAPAKIHIVPPAYTPPHQAITTKSRRPNEPLKVLWLGTLCLRKGIGHALEAARRLRGLPVTFTFAGPTTINLAEVEWPDNASYLGQVPRVDVDKLWGDHDIFLLPTLSDGFAMTQLEAVAHGLALVVTPNCGEVVEEGRNGLRVAPRDPGAIVDAITKFLDGQVGLECASRHAVATAAHFSPERVWPQLHAVLSREQAAI